MELLFCRCAPVTRSLAQQALQDSSEPDDLVQNALDIFSCDSIDFDSRKGTRRPPVLKIEQPTGVWGNHLVYNPRSNCEMLRSKHRARTCSVRSPGSLFACSRSCKKLLLKPEYTDICMRDKPRDSRSARRRSPNRTPMSVDFALAIHPIMAVNFNTSVPIYRYAPVSHLWLDSELILCRLYSVSSRRLSDKGVRPPRRATCGAWLN
jgi:hypothetical protein